MTARQNGAPQPGATPDPDDEQPQQPTAARTRAEERIAALDTSGASLSAQLDESRDQLTTATEATARAEAGWQRSQADFANYKRRTEQERTERAGLASDSLLLKVVALADDFDLAVEHVPPEAQASPWVEGISAIDRKLRALLESEGVKPMQAEGKIFDPNEHQAISYEETAAVPDGTVLKVLQQGYLIRDRILRPALVAVARNDESASHFDDTMND